MKMRSIIYIIFLLGISLYSCSTGFDGLYCTTDVYDHFGWQSSIKIKGDSFYRYFTRLKIKGWSQYDGRTIFAEKGTIKNTDDKLIQFLPDNKVNDIPIEVECIPTNNNNTIIYDRVVCEYENPDTVPYYNYPRSLYLNRIYSDTLRHTDLSVNTIVNGSLLNAGFSGMGMDSIGKFIKHSYMEVKKPINTLQMVVIERRITPGGSELNELFPVLLTEEVKCHIPPGSIVKITAHVNNNAFCCSYMNNRYARIEGRKMTLYALHPKLVSVAKSMYQTVILKRQLFR